MLRGDTEAPVLKMGWHNWHLLTGVTKTLAEPSLALGVVAPGKWFTKSVLPPVIIFFPLFTTISALACAVCLGGSGRAEGLRCLQCEQLRSSEAAQGWSSLPSQPCPTHTCGSQECNHHTVPVCLHAHVCRHCWHLMCCPLEILYRATASRDAVSLQVTTSSG